MQENFKIGDIVARKSYNFDVLFRITNIINDSAELVGITVRIVADAPVYDLKHIDDEEKDRRIKNIELSRQSRMSRCYNGMKKKLYPRDELRVYDSPNYFEREKIYKKPGIILHIDGDAHLSNKEKYSNTNTSEQVIFNHNKNNVSKIKIHYFFITKREEFCEREHI